VVLFAFALFLCTLIWLADSGRGQWLFDLARLIPGEDKTGHLVLFGLLSLLVNVVLQSSRLRLGRLILLKGSVLVAAFAIAEEVSQLFFRSRTFDLLDLGAGLVGIWLFGRLACRLNKQPALAPQAVRSSYINQNKRD
jgi:hypothetical protein